MEIVYYETIPDLDTYFELRRSVDWNNFCPEQAQKAINKSAFFIADNPEREHLIEELADVLMYYNDVLLCYGITAEELKETYTSKFQKNMKRW